MSIIGPVRHDDSGYLVGAHGALFLLGSWLKDGSRDEGSLNPFFLILQAMAAETPYTPPRDTRRGWLQHQLQDDDRFKYRRPVWEAIATQIDRVNGGPPLTSLKEKADWLTSQLQLCYWLRQYDAALRRFQNELGSIGLSVHFRTNEWAEPDVVVTGSFKSRAEAAVESVSSIVDALLPVLIEMVKNKK